MLKKERFKYIYFKAKTRRLFGIVNMYPGIGIFTITKGKMFTRSFRFT